MGIKVHGGVRFETGDLHALMPKLIAFRHKIEQHTRAETTAFVARTLVRNVDDAAARGEPVPEEVLVTAFAELRERVDKVKETGRRDPAVDFQFEITVMPFEGKLYGLMNTEQRDFADMFYDEGFADSYYFSDVVDDSDVVGEIEWWERQRVWYAIFQQDTSWRPGACGLTMDVPTALHYPDLEEIVEHVPTRGERARACAERILQGELWHEHLVRKAAEAPPEEFDEFTTGFGVEEKRIDFRDVLGVARTVNAPTNAERLAAHVERIAPLLPEITLKWMSDHAH